MSVSVRVVSVRSTEGFSGTGVLAGDAFETVGVSFPVIAGPPYRLAGAETLTEELNESDLGTLSLKAETKRQIDETREELAHQHHVAIPDKRTAEET